MSGWQVAKSAKEKDPSLPVVLLTGWSIQQDEEKVQDAGVDFIVSKPCTLGRFRRMLDEALAMRSRRMNG
jgi:CheY-like chemotaxis protein